MNEMLEALFMNFLESAPTGALAAAMQQLGSIIDRQIEAGAVDPDTIADYECAAMRYGYAGGFAAALRVLESKRAA